MRPIINLKSAGKLAELMRQNAQALEGECYIVIARSLYYINHGARVVSGALREEYETVGMAFSSLRPRMRAEVEQIIFSAARQPEPQTTQISQRHADPLPTHRLLRVTNLEALQTLMHRNPEALTYRNYISINNVLFCLNHHNRMVTAAERDLGLYWQYREGATSFARRMNHPEQLAAIAAIIFPETSEPEEPEQQASGSIPPVPYATTIGIDWQLAVHVDLSDLARVPNFVNHMALSVYLQHHPTGLHHHPQIIIEGICYGINHATRTVTTTQINAEQNHYRSYLQECLFPSEQQPSFIEVFTSETAGAMRTTEEGLEEELPWNMGDIEAWLAGQPEELEAIPVETLLGFSPPHPPACLPDQQERQAEERD